MKDIVLPKVWKPSNIYPSAKIGNGTRVGAFCEIGEDVVIGEDCKIGAFSFIPRGVVIEDEVFVGPRVTFTNDKHPQVKGDWELLYTTVCKGASIGAGAIILPGIIIGEYAHIGAGAVVTRDVLPASTVVGVPALPVVREWI